MNKRNILIIVIILLVLGLGFGIYKMVNKKEVNNNEINNNTNEALDNSGVSNNSNILVAYFSKKGENYNVGKVDVGNTALVAGYITEYLNADSFEIVPINEYPDSYDECLKVATKEKNDKARPEIKNKLDNIDTYDMPMIIYSFLEEYNFDGKTIIPFNTHEGSGSSGTYDTIKNKLTNSSINTKGLALQGKVAREEDGKNKTIKWLKELGY